MRSRCLKLIFFISLFIPINKDLYIQSTFSRKENLDYEKLWRSYEF